MKILFTVCGRAGSKGLKNKNLKDLLGAPLVYYTLAAIYEYKKSLCESDIVDIALNTDSAQLIDLVCAQKKLPIFVIRRTDELSSDAVPKVTVIKDCLIKGEKYYKHSFDVVVDLDITSPLRTVCDIRNAVDMKLRRSDVDAIYSVVPSRRNPYFNMVKEVDAFSNVVISSSYTARQQAPAIYDMNASIYAYSPDALRKKNSVGFFNSNCFFTVMKDTAILDIDSEEDYELLQVIAEYLFSINSDFIQIKESAYNLVQ